MYLLTQRGGTTAARIIVMIDKYRLEDMRRESGEKGELARWVIQLQADLDREIRKSASERAMLSRLAVIMHGSETDLNLLTVTAQSLMDRCKAGNSPATPDCSCRTCRPVTFTDSRFVVCPECGNKRCPHANDHRNACTGSNAPGQEGSAYPAAPQQEVK